MAAPAPGAVFGWLMTGTSIFSSNIGSEHFALDLAFITGLYAVVS
ncbi:MAG: hypothetical protein ACREVO_18530 [Steroidobacteraceae bacterium]